MSTDYVVKQAEVASTFKNASDQELERGAENGNRMKLLSALSRKLPPLLLAVALLQWFPAVAGRTTIRGAVTTLGPDGLPVYLPGAEIILRCEESAAKLETTVTDENGRFSFSGLTPGKCNVTASAQGFRSESKFVAPAENSAVELSFQLELQTITERRDRP